LTSDAIRRDPLPAPPETSIELGSAHANLDPGRLPPATRAAPLKRAALRLMRVFTHGQVQFNRAVLGVIDRWDAHLRELHDHLAGALARSETRLSRLEEGAVRREELDERIYPLQIRTEDLERDLEELEERADAIAAGAKRVEEDLTEHLASETAFAGDAYFAFENQFRGPREEILRRQKVYVPFLRDAAARGSAGARFLDLGCGRGELLELAAEAGLVMEGWDSDPAMVAHCRGLGLDARLGDLFDGLRSAPEGSLAGITALQVIEHLPYRRIRELLELASARLRRGGLLALETINPESWYAMRSFHADPTHRQPVPPATCKFLMEMSGFGEIAIQFLQPVSEEESRRVTGGDARLEPLAAFLMGYQDYAALGRRM
jgi:O-antigen chain-terminating methyltransferase